MPEEKDIEAAESTISTIANAYAEIDASTQKYEEEKQKLLNVVEKEVYKLAQNINGDKDLLHKYIHHLYWKTPIACSIISKTFHLSTPSILSIAGKMPDGRLCVQCGLPLLMKSRSSKTNKYFLQTIYGKCDNCIKQESKLTFKRLEKAHKKKEQRLAVLQSMPYYEYLQTPEWQKKRKYTLKSVNFQCQLCNSREKLNVHHRTYKNRGNEGSKDLMVLCQLCHEKFHKEVALCQ